MDYDGGRSRSDIVARAMDLYSVNAPPPELLEVHIPYNNNIDRVPYM